MCEKLPVIAGFPGILPAIFDKDKPEDRLEYRKDLDGHTKACFVMMKVSLLHLRVLGSTEGYGTLMDLGR